MGHCDGGLPSSVALLHHLISLVLYSLALYSTIYLTLLSASPATLSAKHTQPSFWSFFCHILALHFFSNYLQSISHHISCFFLSTYLPVSSSPSCLSASASIEGPSVPIHHALHFSLLAGINHKYFIIHHGRLSPAHRQFITAALSAGLRWRL